MKPDWKNAPGWAQWLAQDLSGVWYWYENKPEPYTENYSWDNDGGKFLICMIEDNENWRETREQRPTTNE